MLHFWLDDRGGLSSKPSSNRTGGRRSARQALCLPERLEPRLALSAAGLSEACSSALLSITPDVEDSQVVAQARRGTSNNFFATPQDLGTLEESVHVNGSVGFRDWSDFYRFEITDSTDVTIELSDLQADVDLRVYNASGKLIGLSDNAGSASELLAQELDSGAYYVQVYPYRIISSSTYQLDISAAETAPPAPPVPNLPTTPSTPATPSTPTQPPSSGSAQPTPAPSQSDVFPNVAYYGGSNDWNLNAVNAPEAWAQGYTGDGVVVAVIDTGVDLDHVELSSSIWVNVDEIPGNGRDDDRNGYVDDVHGWDFANDDSNPNDLNGHGTHVAGTIAAARNGSGATGLAYDATIMPVQVLSASGSGSMVDVAAGIRYAVDNGADVINLSLGGGGYSSTLHSALAYAEQHNVFVAAASGNEGAASPAYPASFGASLSNVISVGAHTSSNQIASFSNAAGTSGVVQVDAPGAAVYSTVPDDAYARYSGTSMATPHVAALGALALSANPNLSVAQLRNLIADGASRTISGSDAAGGINAARTVAQAVAYRAGISSGASSGAATSAGLPAASALPFASRQVAVGGPVITPIEMSGPDSPTSQLHLARDSVANGLPTENSPSSASRHEQPTSFAGDRGYTRQVVSVSLPRAAHQTLRNDPLAGGDLPGQVVDLIFADGDLQVDLQLGQLVDQYVWPFV